MGFIENLFYRAPLELPTTNTAKRKASANTAANPKASNSSENPPHLTNSRQNGFKPTLPRRSTRPGLSRMPTVETEYMNMLLRLDTIPRWCNILSSFCGWILLAGYLVFPSTFTSLTESEDDISGSSTTSQAAHVVIQTVKNIGLLWLAGCTDIRTFRPGFMNSVAGVISTLVNVYSAQGGHFSITAKVTTGVTGGCTVVFVTLFAVYKFLFLRNIQNKHNKAVREAVGVGEVEERENHIGPLEKLERKVKEPPAMQGGVV
ncbi:MAG: hypothetical protein M1834_007737 [Cirrosporium novae-zelandiae]|nr:MAG: hypothetical protein M1834_007737 [Cirrosporium novae-zelandiae]